MNSLFYNENREKELISEIQELTSNIDKDNHNPELYYKRALQYYQLSQQYYDVLELFSFIGDEDKYYKYVNQAYEDISKALSFNIDHYYANHFRIFMLKKLKRWEELVYYGQKLLEEYGGTSLDHSLLGEAYFYMDNWEKCIEHYSIVIEDNIEHATGYDGHILIERGLSYYSIREPELAIKDYLKYIELNEVSELDRYNIYGLLAYAYEETSEWEKSINAYSEAININDKKYNYYFNRGKLYCDKNQDYSSAVKDFDKAIELCEDEEPMLYHYCGYAYVHKGQNETFSENYEQALKDYDKAIFAYQKEIELSSTDNNGEYTVDYAKQLKKELLEKMEQNSNVKNKNQDENMPKEYKEFVEEKSKLGIDIIVPKIKEFLEKPHDYIEYKSMLDRLNQLIVQFESGKQLNNTEDTNYFSFETNTEFLYYSIIENPSKNTIYVSPDYFYLYFFTGYIYFEVNDIDNALLMLNKALRWNPISSAVFSELSSIYMKIDITKAINYAKEIIKYATTSKDLAKAYRDLGYDYIELNEYDIASACLLKSLNFEDTQKALNELHYIEQVADDTYELPEKEQINSILEENDIPLMGNPKMGAAMLKTAQAYEEHGVNKEVVSKIVQDIQIMFNEG